MQFILKEKEHDVFRKKLSRKTKMGSIKTDVVMLIVSLVTTVLGVYCSYFAYLKLGIDSMLNLCSFILGITLAVIGLQRTFDWLGSLIEKLSGMKLPMTDLLPREYDYIKPTINACNIDIDEKGVKVNVHSYMKGLGETKYKLAPATEKFYDLDRVCVIADKSREAFLLVIYMLFENKELESLGLSENAKEVLDAFYLSCKWYDFSCDYKAALEEFRKLLPEGSVVELEDFEPLLVSNSMFVDMRSLVAESSLEGKDMTPEELFGNCLGHVLKESEEVKKDEETDGSVTEMSEKDSTEVVDEEHTEEVTELLEEDSTKVVEDAPIEGIEKEESEEAEKKEENC